jgi:hypothetical protein
MFQVVLDRFNDMFSGNPEHLWMPNQQVMATAYPTSTPSPSMRWATLAATAAKNSAVGTTAARPLMTEAIAIAALLVIIISYWAIGCLCLSTLLTEQDRSVRLFIPQGKTTFDDWFRLSALIVFYPVLTLLAPVVVVVNCVKGMEERTVQLAENAERGLADDIGETSLLLGVKRVGKL